MVPLLSDKYSARERAISLPREPGGLIKTIRCTITVIEFNSYFQVIQVFRSNVQLDQLVSS